MSWVTIRTKFTAVFTAAALIFGSVFGNIFVTDFTALAEETGWQDAASEEETAPQAAEENAGSQNAGEEPDIRDTEEADPQTAEAAEEETVPQEAETEKETVPQTAEEPVYEDDGRTVPERETEPEEDRKNNQSGEPSGGDSVDNAGMDDSEEKEGMNISGNNDAGSMSGELPDPFSNPDLYEQTEFIGTVEISLVNEGMLGYGDEIILKAGVRDVNSDYRLVWEANDNDDRGWFVVGSGEEYRFILDPQNVERGYRVVIIAVA